MDQTRMNEAIGSIRTRVEQAITSSPSPEDAVLAPLVLAGIELVGELLLDVKRIADAAGPPVHLHFHCPEGAVLNAVGDAVRIEPLAPPAPNPLLDLEPLSRFLAGKEAFRKIMDDVPLPELTARRRAWVDANWYAFRTEADELLAAATGRAP